MKSLTILLPLLLFFSANPAKAQCVDVAGTISCSTDDTNGFFSGAAVSSIEVESGAEVDDTGNAGNGAAGGTGSGVIEIDGNVVGHVINNGTITDTGADTDAIFINGIVSGRFINNGDILGNDGGLDALNVLGGIVNNGSITVSNDISRIRAILLQELDGNFSNTGFISATSVLEVADGVEINGDMTGDFANSGTIVATTIDHVADAVEINGDMTGDFTNSGTIVAATFGHVADGVEINGDLMGNFTNHGLISSTSSTSISDAVEINNNLFGSFINTGVITATSDTDPAIAVEAHDVFGRFINSGSIVATSAGPNDAVLFNSISGEIRNSGSIIAGTDALTVVTGDTRLSLLPGSVIQGAIDLGTGTNTLKVANGLNIAKTFTTAPPDVIQPNGAPFVVNGNQVIVIDPTGLAAARTWLQSTTGAILNAVEGSTDQHSDNVHSTGRALEGDNIGLRLWASTLGGMRNQIGSGPTVDAELAYLGVILGAEKILTGDFRLGFFLGGTQADFDVKFGAQSADIDTVFGGLYAKRDWSRHWINMIVTGGWAAHDSRRVVANNLVVGGLEAAAGDYDGYFIAPSITFGKRLENVVANHVLMPSLRVNYAGLFLDGYTESGILDPLTVNDRDVHLLSTRAQLALPHTMNGANGAQWEIESRIGLEGNFSLGDDNIDGTVAGLPLDFDSSFSDNSATGFLGGSIKRISADGTLSLEASAEGHHDLDGSDELRGNFTAAKYF